MTYEEVLKGIFNDMNVEYSITEYSRDKESLDVSVEIKFDEYTFSSYGDQYDYCYKGLLYSMMKEAYVRGILKDRKPIASNFSELKNMFKKETKDIHMSPDSELLEYCIWLENKIIKHGAT